MFWGSVTPVWLSVCTPVGVVCLSFPFPTLFATVACICGLRVCAPSLPCVSVCHWVLPRMSSVRLYSAFDTVVSPSGGTPGRIPQGRMSIQMQNLVLPDDCSNIGNITLGFGPWTVKGDPMLDTIRCPLIAKIDVDLATHVWGEKNVEATITIELFDAPLNPSEIKVCVGGCVRAWVSQTEGGEDAAQRRMSKRKEAHPQACVRPLGCSRTTARPA